MNLFEEIDQEDRPKRRQRGDSGYYADYSDLSFKKKREKKDVPINLSSVNSSHRPLSKNMVSEVWRNQQKSYIGYLQVISSYENGDRVILCLSDGEKKGLFRVGKNSFERRNILCLSVVKITTVKGSFNVSGIGPVIRIKKMISSNKLKKIKMIGSPSPYNASKYRKFMKLFNKSIRDRYASLSEEEKRTKWMIESYLHGTVTDLLEFIKKTPETQKNEEERIKFLNEDIHGMEYPHFSKIDLRNGTVVYVPNYVLGEVHDPSHLEFHPKIPSTSQDLQNILFKLFYGAEIRDEEIDEKVIICLYEIVKHCKIADFIIPVLDLIKHLSIKECVKLFAFCVFFMYEKEENDITLQDLDELLLSDEEEEIKDENSSKSYGYKSSLSLATAKHLSNKRNEAFTIIGRLFKDFKGDALKDRIRSPIQSPLEKHTEVMEIRPKEATDGTKTKKYDMKSSQIRLLNRLRKSADKRSTMKLRSKRNVTVGKEFLAHREVLITRSNFFKRMLSFGGLESVEANETGIVSIEDLENEAIEIVMKKIYQEDEWKEEIKEIPFHQLFDLFRFGEMYQIWILQTFVIFEINRRMDEAERNDQFVLKLLEVGSGIWVLPENTITYIVGVWDEISGSTKRKVIEKAVEQGVKLGEAINGMKTLELQVEALGRPKKRERSRSEVKNLNEMEDEDEEKKDQKEEEESEKKRRKLE